MHMQPLRSCTRSIITVEYIKTSLPRSEFDVQEDATIMLLFEPPMQARFCGFGDVKGPLNVWGTEPVKAVLTRVCFTHVRLLQHHSAGSLPGVMGNYASKATCH